METLPAVRRVRVREDGDVLRLVADGDVVGRIKDGRIELAGLDAAVERSGERTALVAARSPLLRFDPAGGKATTLTLTRRRFRLAKQRYVPGLKRWVLTDGVAGEPVLKVMISPLGTQVDVVDEDAVSGYELTLLVAGALAVVLGIGPAEDLG